MQCGTLRLGHTCAFVSQLLGVWDSSGFLFDFNFYNDMVFYVLCQLCNE